MTEALRTGKALDIVPSVEIFHLPFFPQAGKGSREPQQRMESEETKGSHEEGSHPPEGQIKNRVFRPIMMGGMGQVTRKSPVRIRMASLAGLDHLIKSHMGVRIVYCQNIMGPVTVGTFGRFQIS